MTAEETIKASILRDLNEDQRGDWIEELDGNNYIGQIKKNIITFENENDDGLIRRFKIELKITEIR